MPRFKKTFTLSTFLLVTAALAAYVAYEVREIGIDAEATAEIKKLEDQGIHAKFKNIPGVSRNGS
ncbi:MAG: hypothetical protein QM811_26640 [Pirellulales bacterium]